MKIPAAALLLVCTAVAGTESETLTLRLTRRSDARWEKADATGMYAFLGPDRVDETPFRTEIGRDQVRNNARAAGEKKAP